MRSTRCWSRSPPKGNSGTTASASDSSSTAAKHFVQFQPEKQTRRLEPKLKRADELDAELDASDLDVMEYDRRWGRYRIRMTKGDINKHQELLVKPMKTDI